MVAQLWGLRNSLNSPTLSGCGQVWCLTDFYSILMDFLGGGYEFPKCQNSNNSASNRWGSWTSVSDNHSPGALTNLSNHSVFRRNPVIDHSCTHCPCVWLRKLCKSHHVFCLTAYFYQRGRFQTFSAALMFPSLSFIRFGSKSKLRPDSSNVSSSFF